MESSHYFYTSMSTMYTLVKSTVWVKKKKKKNAKSKKKQIIFNFDNLFIKHGFFHVKTVSKNIVSKRLIEKIKIFFQSYRIEVKKWKKWKKWKKKKKFLAIFLQCKYIRIMLTWSHYKMISVIYFLLSPNKFIHKRAHTCKKVFSRVCNCVTRENE